MVEDGEGELVYEGKKYELRRGDVVFIDCRKAYSHSTGLNPNTELWSLRWCHFYGPNMGAIYRKYQERGGKPVFQTNQLQSYYDGYYGAAEPPVRCGESHLSGLTEPPIDSYSA